jgi:hypothetical protein
MANYITSQVDGNSASLVEAVDKSVGVTTGSAEEKQERQLELAKAQMQYDLDIARNGTQAMESDRADRENARQYQLSIQQAEHVSRLEKNIHPILSISIVLLTFCIYAFILSSGSASGIMLPNSGMKDIVIYILGALTTVATQVVSYYFGSSSGSAEKNKALTALTRK